MKKPENPFQSYDLATNWEILFCHTLMKKRKTLKNKYPDLLPGACPDIKLMGDHDK